MSCDSSCDTNTKQKHSTYCSDSNSSDECDYSERCQTDCNLKFSDTLVGVWNFIYQYEILSSSENTDSNVMTMDRPSQLLFNVGGTFSSNSTPDLRNNPFGSLLSTGVGVWTEIGERRYKLEETHIGYRPSDGTPSFYFKVCIKMKVSRRGNKARFSGRSIQLSISNDELCEETGKYFDFTGFGFKILEP